MIGKRCLISLSVPHPEGRRRSDPPAASIPTFYGDIAQHPHVLRLQTLVNQGIQKPGPRPSGERLWRAEERDREDMYRSSGKRSDVLYNL